MRFSLAVAALAASARLTGVTAQLGTGLGLPNNYPTLVGVAQVVDPPNPVTPIPEVYDVTVTMTPAEIAELYVNTLVAPTAAPAILTTTPY
jgi:hypothetical protein